MKIVKPSAYVYKPSDYEKEAYRFIEKIGRTCYKSEDKITEESAIPFVLNCMKRGHFSILEHWYMYYVLDRGTYAQLFLFSDNPSAFKYFNFAFSKNHEDVLISGSMRAFYELFDKYRYTNTMVDIMESIAKLSYSEVFSKGQAYHYNGVQMSLFYRDSVCNLSDSYDLKNVLAHTVRFVCDRGISHELVRHRNCAFTQESTRYCNYGHDGEIEVIEPYFFRNCRKEKPWVYHTWENSCKQTEEGYISLINESCSPQEARSVLPNSLKTEIVITATEEEWQHIIDLRYRETTGPAHPQMRELMKLAVKDLHEQSYGRIDISLKGE